MTKKHFEALAKSMRRLSIVLTEHDYLIVRDEIGTTVCCEMGKNFNWDKWRSATPWRMLSIE